MSLPRQRIRLVLLDAFDTLITPRQPIHIQYAEEAQKAGLHVSAADIRQGFKTSFPALNKRFPLYGAQEVPPMTAEAWWTFLIRETMVSAGSSADDVERALPTLGPRLLHRFASKEGYKAFPEAHAALASFSKLGVKTAVLSNADDRILSVLDSLELSPLLTAPPTLNHTCGFSKPDARIFALACAGAGVRREEALMIGDELEADYRGARAAGLQALLLRRAGEFSDGATRSAIEDLAGVRAVAGLEQAVAFVREWNEGCTAA